MHVAAAPGPVGRSVSHAVPDPPSSSRRSPAGRRGHPPRPARGVSRPSSPSAVGSSSSSGPAGGKLVAWLIATRLLQTQGSAPTILVSPLLRADAQPVSGWLSVGQRQELMHQQREQPAVDSRLGPRTRPTTGGSSASSVAWASWSCAPPRRERRRHSRKPPRSSRRACSAARLARQESPRPDARRIWQPKPIARLARGRALRLEASGDLRAHARRPHAGRLVLARRGSTRTPLRRRSSERRRELEHAPESPPR